MTHKPATGNETILLVEDEGTIREMAKMFLETQGYQVMEASNGPEAVKIWEKDQKRIDLVVTDLVMPEGLTGRQLAERLQQDRSDLKVIFSSGYSCDLFGEDSVLDSDTNFLQKPYRLNTLAQMIRDCLDGAAAPAE